MDQFSHESFLKLAQDVGKMYGIPFPGMEKAGQEGASYVGGLDPQTEWTLRMRTEAASKMKHLPPELAYALTGEMPLTTSPEANIRIQEALAQASDPKRALKKGIGMGIPGAALGGLIGNLVGQGEAGPTIAGAALGGGALGYSRYRGEKKMQQQLAEQLAQARTEYQMSQEQALQQQMEAEMQMQQAQQAEQAAQELAAFQAQQGGRRRAKTAAVVEESYDASYRKRKKPTPFGAYAEGDDQPDGHLKAATKDNRAYDASDEARKTRGIPIRIGSHRDGENRPIDTPTYGVGWGEKLSSDMLDDARLRSMVHSVAETMRQAEKRAAASGVSGAGVGVGGVGKPASPSAGGTMSVATAPRITGAATSMAGAMKPPPGMGLGPGKPATPDVIKSQNKGRALPGPGIAKSPANPPNPGGGPSVSMIPPAGMTGAFNTGMGGGP